MEKTQNVVNDDSGRSHPAARALGERISKIENLPIAWGTSGVYGFRVRHPFVYGLLAFIVGGGLIAVFTMTTYSNWVYEGVNLKVALYQVVIGGFCAGIVSVALAFAYAYTVGKTVGPLKADGVIGSGQ